MTDEEDLRIKHETLRTEYNETRNRVTELIALAESLRTGQTTLREMVNQSNNNAQSYLYNMRDELKEYIDDKLEVMSGKFTKLEDDIDDKLKEITDKIVKINTRQTVIFSIPGILVFAMLVLDKLGVW